MIGVVLIVVAGVVLAATIAASPAVLGLSPYAFLGWLLAPLIVAAVALSVGLASAMMAFTIPGKFCGDCGRTIDIDSKFCKHCGHRYVVKDAAAL